MRICSLFVSIFSLHPFVSFKPLVQIKSIYLFLVLNGHKEQIIFFLNIYDIDENDPAKIKLLLCVKVGYVIQWYYGNNCKTSRQSLQGSTHRRSPACSVPWLEAAVPSCYCPCSFACFGVGSWAATLNLMHSSLSHQLWLSWLRCQTFPCFDLNSILPLSSFKLFIVLGLLFFFSASLIHPSVVLHDYLAGQ